MARSCFNHIQAPAVFTCAQCSMPLCANCVSMVGQIPACFGCAPALRARITQPPAATAPSGAAGQPAGIPQAHMPQPAPYYGAGMDGASAAAVARANQEHGRNLALGLLAGLAIGIAASVLVLKILFYSHFGLSYLYIGVGYGIGYGIWKLTGRGGPGLAMMAVVIMAISLLVGHFVYASDALAAAKADGSADPGLTVMDVFPAVIRSFSFMHWICIAVGLFSCYRGVAQQEG